MITSTLAQWMLGWIFVDSESPFTEDGFELSLHHAGADESGSSEVSGMTYARARIGCGPGSWEVEGRTVTNLVDITFPATDEAELIRGVESMVLWGAGHDLPLFQMDVDSPGVNVGGGDSVVIPAGGLVITVA